MLIILYKYIFGYIRRWPINFDMVKNYTKHILGGFLLLLSGCAKNLNNNNSQMKREDFIQNLGGSKVAGYYLYEKEAKYGNRIGTNEVIVGEGAEKLIFKSQKVLREYLQELNSKEELSDIEMDFLDALFPKRLISNISTVEKKLLDGEGKLLELLFEDEALLDHLTGLLQLKADQTTMASTLNPFMYKSYTKIMDMLAHEMKDISSELSSVFPCEQKKIGETLSKIDSAYDWEKYCSGDKEAGDKIYKAANAIITQYNDQALSLEKLEKVRDDCAKIALKSFFSMEEEEEEEELKDLWEASVKKSVASFIHVLEKGEGSAVSRDHFLSPTLSEETRRFFAKKAFLTIVAANLDTKMSDERESDLSDGTLSFYDREQETYSNKLTKDYLLKLTDEGYTPALNQLRDEHRWKYFGTREVMVPVGVALERGVGNSFTDRLRGDKKTQDQKRVLLLQCSPKSDHNGAFYNAKRKNWLSDERVVDKSLEATRNKLHYEYGTENVIVKTIHSRQDFEQLLKFEHLLKTKSVIFETVILAGHGSKRSIRLGDELKVKAENKFEIKVRKKPKDEKSEMETISVSLGDWLNRITDEKSTVVLDACKAGPGLGKSLSSSVDAYVMGAEESYAAFDIAFLPLVNGGKRIYTKFDYSEPVIYKKGKLLDKASYIKS